MNLISYIALALIAVMVWILIFRTPKSSLIIQLPNDSDIEEIARYLEEHGIETLKKNMWLQGIISKKGGPSADPSIHIVHQEDLIRARELTKALLDAQKLK